MIKANDAIRTARSMLGTSYSTYDCIEFVVQIIRRSPGGIKDYRCQGTNWLWDSVNNSGKYKHLIARYESLTGAKAGMLAFKRYGADAEDHVGLVTGEGTVIHSSSVDGRGVVETPLTGAEGWDLLGVHRYIEVAEGATESEETVVTARKMQVNLSDETSTVNVRNGPGTSYSVINRLGHGAVVTVQSQTGEWAFAGFGDSGGGYIHTDYLVDYTEPEPALKKEHTTLIRADGVTIRMDGDWRVAED